MDEGQRNRLAEKGWAMTLRQIVCGIKTRHRRELMASAGTHSIRMQCDHCGRERVVDLDIGTRPIPFVPVRHSLAPRVSDRWGR
jgi:hypothetical protein